MNDNIDKLIIYIALLQLLNSVHHFHLFILHNHFIYNAFVDGHTILLYIGHIK